ncbi:MAG TPA: SH3 domain-containing protein [Steroidobacteraceae bacterium]|nr:SH3 domain-containing protein [Steroidobacteraceae bacterium]
MRLCALVALLVCLALTVAPRPVWAAGAYLQVFVHAPYLELHTGPGRGYPVFNVVERDASVDVLKRYTDWFKVRTASGVEGWASAHDMEQTLLADGTAFHYDVGDLSAFTSHRFEAGAFFYGDYGGASAVSLYGAVFANPNLAAELSIGEFLGPASDGTTLDLGLAHIFYPQARVAPFVMIGTGVVRIEPKATLVQPEDRTEQSAYVGGGVRYYLTRRFFLRGEFKEHIIFTNRNQNQQVDEWKFGFAFFF